MEYFIDLTMSKGKTYRYIDTCSFYVQINFTEVENGLLR